MRISLQSPLPFDHVVLDDAEVRKISQYVDEWANTWLPIDGLQKNFVSVYVKHCSPSGASADLSLLAALFLLWFVEFNDLSNDSRRIPQLREILADLTKAEESSLQRQIKPTNATAEFLRIVHKRYTPLQTIRLINFLKSLVDATIQETLYGNNLPSTTAYIKLREQTVAVYPYFEFFRLALGALPTSSHVEHYKRLERLAVQGIYMVNDILSIERDLRKNKFNIIRCISAEDNIGIDNAIDKALAISNKIFNDLQTCYNNLVKNETDIATMRYAAFLLTIQEGTRAATFELKQRYFGNG